MSLSSPAGALLDAAASFSEYKKAQQQLKSHMDILTSFRSDGRLNELKSENLLCDASLKLKMQDAAKVLSASANRLDIYDRGDVQKKIIKITQSINRLDTKILPALRAMLASKAALAPPESTTQGGDDSLSQEDATLTSELGVLQDELKSLEAELGILSEDTKPKNLRVKDVEMMDSFVNWDSPSGLSEDLTSNPSSNLLLDRPDSPLHIDVQVVRGDLRNPMIQTSPSHRSSTAGHSLQENVDEDPKSSLSRYLLSLTNQQQRNHAIRQENESTEKLISELSVRLRAHEERRALINAIRIVVHKLGCFDRGHDGQIWSQAASVITSRIFEREVKPLLEKLKEEVQKEVRGRVTTLTEGLTGQTPFL